MSGGFQLARGNPSLLVLLRTPVTAQAIVAPSSAGLINHGASERLSSPLFRIEDGKEPVFTPGLSSIHFFYPSGPAATFDLVARLLTLGPGSVFLTLGNPEVVFVHSSALDPASIRKIQDEVDVFIETWILDDDSYIKTIMPPSPTRDGEKKPLDLSHLLSLFPEDAGYLFREIESLIVRRRDGTSSYLRREYPDAQHYANTLAAALEECRTSSQCYSELWRFAGTHTFSVTQRYTCLPPLISNPCPIGGFELLGVGKALGAIRRFGNFVFGRINDASLPIRIETFLQGLPTVEVALTVGLSADDRGSIALSEEVHDLRNRAGIDNSPAVEGSDTTNDGEGHSLSVKAWLEPLVHYFSARHGFQYEDVGISLPLQSVSSANTFQWNLMSLTHEYCHVITSVLLAGVREYLWSSDFLNYRRLVEEMYIECARSGSSAGKLNAKSGMELFSKAYLYSLVWKEPKDDALRDRVQICMAENRPANEVITLVFDLFYFFRGEIEQHLTMYWSHWLHLPGVTEDANMLTRYLIRSCCAVAAHYLEEPGRACKTLSTEALLQGVCDIIQRSKVIARDDAAIILKLAKRQGTRTTVRRSMAQFLPILCVTKSLLLSGLVREKLWEGFDEDAQKNLDKWKGSLRIEYESLTAAYNPLQLICLDPPSPETDESGSLWLLTLLDASGDANV
jgi:hypothetical protein